MRWGYALVALAIAWANAISHSEWDVAVWFENCIPTVTEVVQGNPNPAP